MEKDGKNEKGGAFAPCHGRNPTRRDIAEHQTAWCGDVACYATEWTTLEPDQIRRNGHTKERALVDART